MIVLRDVSKTFKLYRRPSDRLLEWIAPVRRHQVFHALRHVDLEVPAARTLGIIGINGAGKSTLLKLVAGTLLPTTGSIEISGRVAALLELGTGFHPEFTGRQNIYVNGQLLGLSPEELAALEPEIIAFSELGPFIDQPIRTYSSGMVMRLGFSIAASVNPDVLIVDEALSVGDARFSQKCIRRIREFRDRGTTILFVSHDPGAVKALCDEAILLEAGEIRARGLPGDILDEYNALLAAKGSGNVEMRITRTSGEARGPRRHGTFQALIGRVRLRNGRGQETDLFHPGERLRMAIEVVFLTAITNPTVGFEIRDRLGQGLYGTNTALKGIDLGDCGAGETREIEFEVPVNLGYGTYSITVAVHQDETHLQACYEWTDNAALFHVRHEGKPDWTGMLLLEAGLRVAGESTSREGLGGLLGERFGDQPDLVTAAGGDGPSPFLFGFQPAMERDGTEARPMQSEAVLVYTPRGEEVSFDLEVAEELAERMPISCEVWSGGRVLGRMDLGAGREILRLSVPPDMVGSPALFELRAELPAGRPLLYFYGVRSGTGDRSTAPLHKGA